MKEIQGWCMKDSRKELEMSLLFRDKSEFAFTPYTWLMGPTAEKEGGSFTLIFTAKTSSPFSCLKSSLLYAFGWGWESVCEWLRFPCLFLCFDTSVSSPHNFVSVPPPTLLSHHLCFQINSSRSRVINSSWRKELIMKMSLLMRKHVCEAKYLITWVAVIVVVVALIFYRLNHETRNDKESWLPLTRESMYSLLLITKEDDHSDDDTKLESAQVWQSKIHVLEREISHHSCSKHIHAVDDNKSHSKIIVNDGQFSRKSHDAFQWNTLSVDNKTWFSDECSDLSQIYFRNQSASFSLSWFYCHSLLQTKFQKEETLKERILYFSHGNKRWYFSGDIEKIEK